FWLVPSVAGPAEAALQLDLSGQPSGVYSYNLAVGIMRFVPSKNKFFGKLTPQSSTLTLINAVQSPFGSGWGLAGLAQIGPNADGSALLIDGNGTNLLFGAPAFGSGPYFAPSGDFSTLVKLPDGTFQRTLKNQTVFHFNAQNLLASVTDRNGNQTQYVYDAN